jgi:hypothetical protein
MDKYSTQDALADAKRHVKAWYFIPNAMAGIIWGVAVYWVLDRPDLSEATRTFWEILPWPFLAIGLAGWFARRRRLAEVEREVENQAASISWNLTVFYLLGIVLLEASGHSLELKWVAFWPLLVHAHVWIWMHKRTTGS